MPGIKIGLSADEANAALARFRSNLTATGATAKLTQTQVKSLESQMLQSASVQKSTKGFDDLTKMLGYTRGEANKLGRELGVVGYNMNLLERSGTSLTKMTSGLAMGFMKVGFAVMTIYAAIKTLNAPLDYLGKIESSTLGIATSFMMNGQYIDKFTGKALKGTQALEAAQADAKNMVQELQIANLETIATLDQLIVGYQQALPVAMSQGFSREQAKNFTVAMVQAAGAIDPMLLHQLGEETRSLLMGTINPRTTRIATVMGLSSADNERIKKLSEEGKLYDWLMDKLKVYTIAGEASMNTWAGLWSNFKDIVMINAGEAFSPLFDEIKKWLKETTDGMFTVETSVDSLGNQIKKIHWNEDLVSGIETFKEAIVDTIIYVRRLSIFLDLVGGGMALIGEGLARIRIPDINPQTGQVNWKEREENIKWWQDKGKMYTNRADKSDIAISDMLMKKNADLTPVSKEELMNLFATPESYNWTNMPTGLFSIDRYYKPKSIASESTYVQNKATKEASDKDKEKAENIAEKLREEIEKMTHDARELIELQSAKYLKVKGVDTDLVGKWKDTKLEELDLKENKELYEQLYKMHQDKMKWESEELILKEENAGQLLKIQTDLDTKKLDLEVQERTKTERDVLQSKFDIQQQLFDQEEKTLILKLQLAALDGENLAYLDGITSVGSKELVQLLQKYELLLKQKDLLKETQDIELKGFDLQKRKTLREDLKYFEPGYLQYKQDETKAKAKEMREQNFTGITEYETKANIEIQKEQLQHLVDNSTSAWEVIGAKQKLFGMEAGETAQQWGKVYENSISAVSNSFSDFFDYTSDGFMDLANLAENVANDIAKEFLKVAVINPVVNQAGSWATDLLGMVGLTGTTVVAGVEGISTLPISSLFGNVFENGRIRQFRKGGINNKLTYFPIGSMSEDGKPEAIMPLARDSQGRLGVSTSGEQGSPVVVPMYINTMDAKSFSAFAMQNKNIIAGAVMQAMGNNNPIRGK